MKKDITPTAAVTSGVEEAWRDVGASFERLCLTAGIATLADMMEHDAADLCGRRLEDCVPPSQREAVEAMLDASFFADLAIMPDCQEVIRELAARHDIFIVSAAMDVPRSFDAKFGWLRRHFPFIPPAQIVFCGDKSICEADYLIDDCARHFAGFRGRPLLFSAPHNVGESRYPRVDSWKAVREVFARIPRPLEKPARKKKAAPPRRKRGEQP